MRGVGSQIIAGRRIRFPDHPYVGGPWGEDEEWVHAVDAHGANPSFAGAHDEHFRLHEGYEVQRVFVGPCPREQLERYLGFGAEITETMPGDPYPYAVDVPPEHAQYLIDRLASGLIGTRREEIQA